MYTYNVVSHWQALQSAVDKTDEKLSEDKAKQHKHICKGIVCITYVFAVSVNFKSCYFLKIRLIT